MMLVYPKISKERETGEGRAAIIGAKVTVERWPEEDWWEDLALAYCRVIA
jgi:hypothetical protein